MWKEVLGLQRVSIPLSSCLKGIQNWKFFFLTFGCPDQLEIKQEEAYNTMIRGGSI